MKLFYSPFHGFIHKVLVTIHETGLWEDVTFVATYPFRNRDGVEQGDRYSLCSINPLDKVPTLVTDDWQVIYGSEPICQYLDAMSRANHLYPEAGPARWDALRRHDRAQTFFENTVTMNMEGWRPDEERHLDIFEWIWPKLLRSLDELEDECRAERGFDIGHAATLHALSYVDFGAKFYEAVDPLYPRYDFRVGRPNLARWYENQLDRPSVVSHLNRDFEGDDSPEYFQAQLAEVVKHRGDS
jgi:glutathione S-transferase